MTDEGVKVEKIKDAKISWLNNTESYAEKIEAEFSLVVVIPEHDSEAYSNAMIKILKRVKNSLSLKLNPAAQQYFELSTFSTGDDRVLPVYFMKEKDYLDFADASNAGKIRITSTGYFENPIVSKKLREGLAGSQVFGDQGVELITHLATQVWAAKNGFFGKTHEVEGFQIPVEDDFSNAEA